MHSRARVSSAGRAKWISDPENWRRLVPELSIERRTPRKLKMTPFDVDRAAAAFASRRFVKLPVFLDVALVRRMAGAVERLRAEDWPAVFLVLFDETWLVVRQGPLRRFLHKTIGRRCYQSPNFWLHVVEADVEARGWPPHCDSMDPRRMTLWMPLTPATVENGCMYLLPPDLIPQKLRGHWAGVDHISRSEACHVLYAVTPLPAEPGSALCWRTDTLHWGGRRTNADQVRIAISMEFTPRPIDPSEIGLPSIPLDGPLPSFEERLRLCSAMIELFHRNDVRAPRYRALVRKWNSRRR